MRTPALLLFLASVVTAPAFATDIACEVILKASEARMSQPAWHTVSEVGAMRVEMIKANNQFFRKVGAKWTKFPVNVDELERKLVAQMRSGETKLTGCKVVGSEVVDGVPVTVVTSHTELKGALPADAKLYIGKADGLPYQIKGAEMSASYRYKGVVAPPL